MSFPPQPPSLQDVLEIVERRRRRRDRVRAVAAPALSATAAAGLVVVAMHAGGGARPVPVAAPPPPSAASSPAPSAASPSARSGVRPPPPASPPPFDDAWLDPDTFGLFANALVGTTPDAERLRRVDEAKTLASAWGLDYYPGAKAVVQKAANTDTVLDAADPHGADVLVNRFRQAGYTTAYARTLAGAWNTDVRTAEVFGALLIGHGCCGDR